MKSKNCQASLIAAPSSRQGKTIVTAGLARRFRNQGNRVAVFKLGPDYLDPKLLSLASGAPVYNLDLWMMGQQYCADLLYRKALENDVILVESLMGLHDNSPSNAAFSELFNLGITLVMDVSKYAQTALAIVEGLEQYPPKTKIRNVIGNRIGSDHHHLLLFEVMGDRYCGSVRRDDNLVLPERHLGLVEPHDLDQIDQQLDLIAKALDTYEIHPGDSVTSFTEPAPLPFIEPTLAGKTIAVAQDHAFSFIYPANLDCLRALGAEISFFSPLNNDPVPHCDGLWLPGGYPELHLDALASAEQTKQDLLNLVRDGLPVLAECGGMMSLCKTTTVDGVSRPGFNVLDADCVMQNRLTGIGLQSVDYGEGEIRGHVFHHSALTCSLKPQLFTSKQNQVQNKNLGEAVYRQNNLTATYFHHYFPSCPQAIAALFIV